LKEEAARVLDVAEEEEKKEGGGEGGKEGEEGGGGKAQDEGQSLYDVLGVDRNAAPETIKRAYYRVRAEKGGVTRGREEEREGGREDSRKC
jgi:hypothetical protein